MTIANTDGDLGPLFPKVEVPATIVIDRLEYSSTTAEETEAP
jgi:hypothetical protein